MENNGCLAYRLIVLCKQCNETLVSTKYTISVTLNNEISDSKFNEKNIDIKELEIKITYMYKYYNTLTLEK